MNKETKKFAQTQANDHAEFLGEYTKYIYRQAHYHGFKHGHEYAQANTPSDYIKACRILTKDQTIRE